jgi:hypothetical protein
VSRRSVGWLLGAVFAAALLATTLRETRVECEVCLEFGGSSVCRSVAAAERDEAISQATATACAVLSSGVTEGLACQRTRPRSLQCDD